jgi:hypothetical protein
MTFMKVSKERIFSCLKALAPYVLLLGLTLVPLYLFFANPGLPQGDDSFWHRLELTDLAYGFEEGFRGLSTGHGFMGASSVDIYGFYGPFVDYFVVLLYELFKGLGASLVGSLKFTLALFCFLSNVFVFLLARRVSGSRNVGLLIAALYNFLPYKMFCILCRAAYPEAVALCFLPLIFYALYRLLNDAEFSVGPYLLLGVSASSLVLTHPITALFAAVSCLLFLAFNCRKVYALCKQWRRLVSFLVTLALTIGLVSPYVFTALINQGTGFYIISDSDLMWTSFDWLVEKTAFSTSYSGFLNWAWLESNSGGTYVLAQNTSNSIIAFFVSGLAVLLLDNWLKPHERANYWRYPLDAALLFVPIAILEVRIEVYLAAGVFLVFLLLSDFAQEKAFLSDVLHREPKDFIKEPNLYFLVFSLIISAILIYLPDAWKAVPSLFYNIQFPYRFWGFFGFFAVCLVLYFAAWLREKRFALNSLAFVAALLFCLCGAPVQDRVDLSKGLRRYYEDASEEEVLQTTGIGWSNDYLPQIYEADSGYESAYANSLYYPIKDRIEASTNSDSTVVPPSFPSSVDDYFSPVCLEGEGVSKVTALKSPEVSFDLTLTSDSALVQIPQFYYDGYQIDVTSLADGSSFRVSPQEVDGLVAFTVEGSGLYEVQVSFPGPLTYRVGRVFFYLSIVGFVELGAWGYWDKRIRPKREQGKAAGSASGEER